MNNSKIALENIEEETEDNRLSFLQKQKGGLAKLIETINRVEASEDWQKLKALLLDDVVDNLEKSLKSEAEKSEIDTSKIYRLQGQLEWARKYADLSKFVEWKKRELESIKNQITYESSPRDGAQ